MLGSRVFLACEFHEDVAYVANKLGDDCLVTATDFPHGYAFRQDYLHDGIEAIGGLSGESVEKILSTNPQRLFAL